MPHQCTTCGRTFDDGSKQMLSGCPDCGGNKFQFQPAGRESSTADASTSSAAEPSVDGDASTEGVDAPRDAPSTDAQSGDTPSTDAQSGDAPSTDAQSGDTPTDIPSTDAPGDTASTDAPTNSIGSAFEGADKDRSQSDAPGSQTTLDEISTARGEAVDERPSTVAEGGRGTPQGPPTDPPSAEESEAFDISGAVGPDDPEPVEKQPVGGATGEPAEPVDGDTDLAALRDELNDQFESIKITAPGQYELNLMELYDRREYIISLQEDGRYVIEMAEEYGPDDS